MTEFHGLPRAEATRRIGTLGQLARVDSFVEANGVGAGTRRMRLVSGGGLELELHPDRAMDIGAVTVDGVPIAWMSPVGMASPAAYDSAGSNWLRTFGGGLLATCGLENHGPAGVDGATSFGLHGRVGAIPASLTQAGIFGEEIVVEALVRQASVLGEDFELRRRISVPLGGATFTVSDTVTNLASSEQPHMVLYHVNLGWPLLDDSATLTISSRSATPRDADAQVEAERWAEITPPVRGYRERVYLHEFEDDEAVVALSNPTLGMALTMRFDTRTLPALAQWKMLNENHYVLGVEPSNVAHLTGRGQAAPGVVPVLQPGEQVSYQMRFEITRRA